MRKDCLILALCLLAACTAAGQRSGDDKWVWRSHNRQERAFRDGNRSSAIRNSYDDKYRRELFSRDREPTTKRPLPGEPENDEIEDYPDAEPNSRPNVGTRQYNPYGAGIAGLGGVGLGGGSLYNAGQFAGTGGSLGLGGIYGGAAYPGSYGTGAGNPGILVGPGGPTGIIGRPQQQQFPGVYQPSFGSFNGLQNGNIGGYPGAGYQGNNYAGYPGLGQQFPGGVGSQFPYGSQYPGVGGEFNGNQFASGGAAQYPGLNGIGGQYPVNQYGIGNAGGPQYTEGYGLATTNGQLGSYGGVGLGLGNFGFDETATKRNTNANNELVEGKSAKSLAVEGRSAADANAKSSVNDKLSAKP